MSGMPAVHDCQSAGARRAAAAASAELMSQTQFRALGQLAERSAVSGSAGLQAAPSYYCRS